MERRGATGSQEFHGGARVTSDKGRNGWMREPGGAGGMTGYSGAEGALAQVRANESLRLSTNDSECCSPSCL